MTFIFSENLLLKSPYSITVYFPIVYCNDVIGDIMIINIIFLYERKSVNELQIRYFFFKLMRNEPEGHLLLHYPSSISVF